MFSTLISNLVSKRLRLLTTLHGNTGPVITLSISPNGYFLASGGTDGIKVWDLKTSKALDVPQQPLNERGQISCLSWVTRNEEGFDTLCYGNALGFLVFLQYRPTTNRFESIYSARLAKGGEILCITVDTPNTGTARIAIGTRDKCVQVWFFDFKSCKLDPVFSKGYGADKDIIPKALAFESNPERDLHVFGLYDGGLYRCGGNDGKHISEFILATRIGNAAVDIGRRLCAIDNVGTGFDVYKMDSGTLVRTLETGRTKKTFPKGVAFANNSRAVVGGSDHGLVYIFERKTGQVLKKLRHSKSGGVETISVHDNDDGTVLIAAASASKSSAPSPILLWQWKPNHSAESSGTEKGAGEGWTVKSTMSILFKLIVVLAALAYFKGVLEEQVGKWFNDVIQAEVARQVMIGQQETNIQLATSNALGTGIHRAMNGANGDQATNGHLVMGGQKATSEQVMKSQHATTSQDSAKKAVASKIGKWTQDVCELRAW